MKRVATIPDPTAPRRRDPGRIMVLIQKLLRPSTLIGLGCVTSLAFAPLISVVVSSAIATRFGCRLDESDAHPCVVLGHDYGDLLADLFVAGWLMLATWPLMLATTLLWIVVGIAALVRLIRRRGPGGSRPPTAPSQ